jgi:hypothetical protein
MYSPLAAFDLAGIYDDLMENLRVRYVIMYRSGSDGDPDTARSVRIELVDPTTGGPLKMVDANGKSILSKITIEDSYIPRSVPVPGLAASAAKAPDVSPAREAGAQE